jgi:hypothetical protein
MPSETLYGAIALITLYLDENPHENARLKNSVFVVFHESATWFTTTGTLTMTRNLELYESCIYGMQQKLNLIDFLFNHKKIVCLK